LVARINNDGAAQMVDSSLTRPTSGTLVRATRKQRDPAGGADAEVAPANLTRLD
jgi:hypothetical protein